MNDRPGCLSGFLKLFLIDKIFNWAQRKFGFGRGGCCGFGFGVILLILFIGLVCSVLSGTDWTRIGF